MDTAKTLGYKILGIVIGPYESGVRRKIIPHYYGVDKYDNVFFHPFFVEIDETVLKDDFNFFWRGYDDWSVSFTLYTAASLKKPVLALNTGFVGFAVDYYQLGATVELDFSNLKEALEKIKTWDPAHAERFLNNHSWKIAANILANDLRKST